MRNILILSALIMIVMIGSSAPASGQAYMSGDSVSFTVSSIEMIPVTSDYTVNVNIIRIVTNLDSGDTTGTGIDITPGIKKVFRGAEAQALIGKKVKIIAVYWVRSNISYPWQDMGYIRIPDAYTILVKANKNYVFDFKVRYYPWDESKKSTVNKIGWHGPKKIF